MCARGLFSPVSNCPRRGHIKEGLTGLFRADNHQNVINCVVPVPVSENS